jgi:AraC-like DNA-binding protein
MGARGIATQVASIRGVVGRAGSTSMFDLDRWAPSDATSRFVEHLWSISWDLREQGAFDSTVITFPSLHIIHDWGDDGPRHGFPLPNTFVLRGVVERVFRTTISERGRVVGARFRPGGFTARFGRDAATLTGRVQPVDDELFGSAIHLDDNIAVAFTRMDELIGAYKRELDTTYVLLTALVDRIRDDDRLHRVEQVMRDSPWSARTTQRALRRHVGVPVKWVLCRYRLQQAPLEIESHPGVDHADLAVRLGWYDQAHFINDFRAMLGATSGEYATTHGS